MQWEGKLDCRTCDDKLKEERGHSKDGIIPFLVDGKRIFRCPLTQITQLSYEYLKAFDFYSKGYLPNGEGWNKESNKFLEAMIVIGNEFKKNEMKNHKK